MKEKLERLLNYLTENPDQDQLDKDIQENLTSVDNIQKQRRNPIEKEYFQEELTNDNSLPYASSEIGNNQGKLIGKDQLSYLKNLGRSGKREAYGREKFKLTDGNDSSIPISEALHNYDKSSEAPLKEKYRFKKLQKTIKK